MCCVAPEMGQVARLVIGFAAAPGLDLGLAHGPDNVNDIYGHVVAVVAHRADAGNDFVSASARR
jgi:hypothetical protein